MSHLDRLEAFVDGAKTSLDWMTGHNAPVAHEPSQYEMGFRHALDAVGGAIDDIREAEQKPA